MFPWGTFCVLLLFSLHADCILPQPAAHGGAVRRAATAVRLVPGPTPHLHGAAATFPVVTGEPKAEEVE